MIDKVVVPGCQETKRLLQFVETNVKSSTTNFICNCLTILTEASDNCPLVISDGFYLGEVEIVSRLRARRLYLLAICVL